jgi:hypothetical protein
MNIKNRQQLLVIVALGLAGLYIGDKMLFTPLLNSWKDRSTRLTELRTRVENGRRLLQREKQLHDRWEHMRANVLPNDTSQGEQQVLQALDVWSQTDRVIVQSITPQWKRDNDDYLTLECRVDATGNLQTLTRFLYDIEKDPLALRLESCELSARDSVGQQLALALQISGLALIPQAK